MVQVTNAATLLFDPWLLNYINALLNAPPGRVEAWAKALMTTEMNLNPHMREVAEIIIQAERETGQYYHELASGQKRQ